MKTGSSAETPIIGIAGWKNSGKTTLVARLVAEFTARGLRVATVKHAHHNFQIDERDADSARHRRAGARQVAIVSAKRWALIGESAAREPTLEEIIARLDPCDLIIVEGYKAESIPKIEVRRTAGAAGAPLAGSDPTVLAIAADHPIEGAPIPVFALDDVPRIADFIASTTGQTQPRREQD